MGRALIVDDDAELNRLIAVAFARSGYEVQATTDSTAAMRALGQAGLDVVITDIIMPDLDGVELIVALKRRHPEVKVIAISGGYRVGPQDFLTLARHLGADGVLAKPFRMSELTDLAADVLGPRDRPGLVAPAAEDAARIAPP